MVCRVAAGKSGRLIRSRDGDPPTDGLAQMPHHAAYATDSGSQGPRSSRKCWELPWFLGFLICVSHVSDRQVAGGRPAMTLGSCVRCWVLCEVWEMSISAPGAWRTGRGVMNSCQRHFQTTPRCLDGGSVLSLGLTVSVSRQKIKYKRRRRPSLPCRNLLTRSSALFKANFGDQLGGGPLDSEDRLTSIHSGLSSDRRDIEEAVQLS